MSNFYPNLDIEPFSSETIRHALSNKYTSESFINSKQNYKNILKGLQPKAQTLLIERIHVSRDFLDSYAGYIVESFEFYPKYCNRIHFFSKGFDEDDLHRELSKPDSSFIKEIVGSYLGFIVVRPIPNSVIGLTILDPRIYIQEENAVLFGVRKYYTHLFGQKIELITLAYQEQDKGTSACATASIWYLLNQIAILPRYYLKSPILITHSAGDIGYNGDQLFPNKGLNQTQMNTALKKSNLGFHMFNMKDTKDTSSESLTLNAFSKGILYSYSFINIPILLVIKIKTNKLKGHHSIAVIGYKKPNSCKRKPTGRLFLVSELVTTFYAHDDQLGPFREIELIDGTREINHPFVKTNKEGGKVDPEEYVKIERIIAATYPKIRIKYSDILKILTGLDNIFMSYFEMICTKDREEAMSWDVRLLFSTDYKAKISSDVDMMDEHREKILSSIFPKYIWVATLLFGESQRIFDFIFDATDLQNSCFMMSIAEYQHKVSYFHDDIRKVLRNKKNLSHFEKFFSNMDRKIWMERLLTLLKPINALCGTNSLS